MRKLSDNSIGLTSSDAEAPVQLTEANAVCVVGAPRGSWQLRLSHLTGTAAKTRATSRTTRSSASAMAPRQTPANTRPTRQPRELQRY